MRKTKLVAVLLAIALILNMVAPLVKVVATTAYTLTFTAASGHVIAEEGGHLTIDGQIVDLRDSGDNNIGEVNIESGTAGSITVTDGTPGVLNYNSADQFTIYDTNGHVAYVMNTELNSDTVFIVEDFEEPSHVDNQAGFNVRYLGTAGDVWYKFGSGEEIKISEDAQDIPISTGAMTIRVGDVTLGAAILRINGTQQDVDRDAFKAGYTFDVVDTDRVEFEIEFCNEEEHTGEEPPVNASFEDIDFDVEWTETFTNIKINGKDVVEESSEFGKHTYAYTETVPNAGTTNPDETNVLRFQPRFGDGVVTEYIINDVTYREGMDSVSVEGDIYTVTVPGAVKYTIRGEANPDIMPPKTIIWANTDANQNADAFEEDMLLEHGSARVIAIFNKDGQEVENDATVDEDGMGFAVVEPGNEVVFEFVPEYGYQLTSVKANGFDLEPQDAINQYTFIMPETNVHFSAEFTKTDDIVKSNSDKVSSGSIKLGNKLEGGSAQLSVSNVELSADKIKGFENAAEGYTVSNYLDIDLYNVFYKGKDDEDDVWTDKISELEKEATISLKLADGITADDIVIVHNIHDGEEYEIIKIDSYNAKTNTITFKTKSFSGYAIATKETEKTSNPKTGDNIIIASAVLVIAVIGTALISKAKSKKSTENK